MVPRKLDAYLTLSVLLSCCGGVQAATYDDAKAIFDKVFSSTNYNPRVQPKDDQSEIVYVEAEFELVSVVEVDDVGQKFMCNGFLPLLWTDERLTWNPEDYGGMWHVRPQVKDIWKPRVVLLNTLEERDLFKDDHAPLSVTNEGEVRWVPGGLFPTSCELDMSNYPFDEQTCALEILSMGYFTTEIIFVGSFEEVGNSFFVANGEWELTGSNVTSKNTSVGPESYLSTIVVSFTLKRRPTFLLLNIVLPVVFLSFLNIFVFLIPVESGEKVSFGVTLLLAVSVFLSIVSGMLPRSSQVVPNVTIYLACLLIMSVLTVIDSVLIVFLHNLDSQEEASIKAEENFKQAWVKIKHGKNNLVAPQSTSILKMASVVKAKQNSTFGGQSLTVSQSETPLPPYEEEENAGRKPQAQEALCSRANQRPRTNRYRLICKYIDCVSFVVFLFIWLGLTVGFLTTMSA